jgi:hypothetical protein
MVAWSGGDASAYGERIAHRSWDRILPGYMKHSGLQKKDWNVEIVSGLYKFGK